MALKMQLISLLKTNFNKPRNSSQKYLNMKNFKNQLLSLLFIAGSLTTFAQVGVGTQTPMTTLDISVGAVPAALATGNGITVPSVTDAATTAVAGTNDGQMVYDTTQKAFYYWNAGTSAWTRVGGGAAAAPSIRSTSASELFATDLNGYIIVTGNTTFDLTTLTTASVGDTITFGAYSQTGFSIAAAGRHPNSVASPGNSGIGIKFIFDGTTWYSVSGQ